MPTQALQRAEYFDKYSAVAERGHEIATMRALRFSAIDVVAPFLFEVLRISFIGGPVGCVAVLPLNDLTTATIKWQTFRAWRLPSKTRPNCLCAGIFFALAMGNRRRPACRRRSGPPTLRVVTALRELQSDWHFGVCPRKDPTLS